MKKSLLLWGAVLVGAGCLAARQVLPPLAVWATGSSRKVFPSDRIESKNYHWDGSSSTVRLKGARNEYVEFQLILNSSRALKDIRLNVSSLSAKKVPALIPRQNIKCFKEIYIPVHQATDRAGSTGTGEYPDPLIPFVDPYSDPAREIALPLSCQPERNQPIWVEILIPKKIPAGNYQGVISIEIGGQISKEIKINLEVWDFTLSDRSPLKIFFDLYGWRWSRGEKLPWKLCEETWEVLSRYEIMAHDHGFSNGHWGLMPEGAECATIGVNWDNYDRYLGTVIDGSLFENKQPPECWELPFPESWDPGDQVLSAYCRELVSHWDQKGWDLSRGFAYVWDEMGPGNPRVKSYGEILHQASDHRINYFYTCPPSPQLFGVVDWWAPRASEYDPPLVRQRQERGEKGFFYHAGEPSVGLMCIDADGLAWRTWAWMAWIYKSDGFFDWAGNFWSENPYQDPMSFDTDNGNMYLFYPGRGLESLGLPPLAGPVSSFRMKALRRGLADYEYFRQAQEKGISVEAAIRMVVHRGLGVTGSYGIDPNSWSRDPEQWDRTRDLIGEMINRKTTTGNI